MTPLNRTLRILGIVVGLGLSLYTAHWFFSGKVKPVRPEVETTPIPTEDVASDHRDITASMETKPDAEPSRAARKRTVAKTPTAGTPRGSSMKEESSGGPSPAGAERSPKGERGNARGPEVSEPDVRELFQKRMAILDLLE